MVVDELIDSFALIITGKIVLSSVIPYSVADRVCYDPYFLCDTGCRLPAVYDILRCSVAKLLGIFTVITWHFCHLLYAYSLHSHTQQKSTQSIPVFCLSKNSSFSRLNCCFEQVNNIGFVTPAKKVPSDSFYPCLYGK